MAISWVSVEQQEAASDAMYSCGVACSISSIESTVSTHLLSKVKSHSSPKKSESAISRSYSSGTTITSAPIRSTVFCRLPCMLSTRTELKNSAAESMKTKKIMHQVRTGRRRRFFDRHLFCNEFHLIPSLLIAGCFW